VDAVGPTERLEEPDFRSLQQDHARKPGAIQKEFLSVLGNTVTRPESIAYALRELLFDEKGCLTGYWAKACTFKLALTTSFVLEYELVKAFSKRKSLRKAQQLGRSELELLPMRRAIHGQSPKEDVFVSGVNRFPILSVQMMVLFKSHIDNKYRTFIIKRSDRVSYGPRTWQFIPCGYFEMFEPQANKYSVRSNFDSRLAIFREMLEELLGKADFIENANGVPADNIMNDDNIKFLIDAIENERAHFRWLGAILDLVTLTHKLSFLLVIDDPAFSTRYFEPNFEARHLQIFLLEQIGDVIGSDLLLPESAGLLRMALEHPLTKQRLSGEIEL